MKTKQDVLNRLKIAIEENPDDRSLSKKFVKFFLIESVMSLICYIIFLVLSLILIENVSKLAIITPKIYIILTSILIGCSILVTGGLLCLYYLKIELPRAKVFYNLYQGYDIINFIFEMIVVLYFIIMFIITPAKVSGESMEATYYDGDTVLVWHLFYEPEIDDVVIINTENGKYGTRDDTDFIIKRVVAISGSKVTYQNGNLIIDGVIVESIDKNEYRNLFIDSETYENYYHENEVIIPEGYLLVLGDNREASYDSTEFGLVRETDVLGKSFLRLYPKFGLPEKNVR